MTFSCLMTAEKTVSCPIAEKTVSCPIALLVHVIKDYQCLLKCTPILKLWTLGIRRVNKRWGKTIKRTKLGQNWILRFSSIKLSVLKYFSWKNKKKTYSENSTNLCKIKYFLYSDYQYMLFLSLPYFLKSVLWMSTI